MKNLSLRLSVLIIISFLSFASFSQSSNRKLIITGRKNIVITKGQIIKVVCKDGFIAKGPLNFNNDSTININGSIIGLNNIRKSGLKVMAQLQ